MTDKEFVAYMKEVRGDWTKFPKELQAIARYISERYF